MRKMSDDEPVYLGRFNYLTFKMDKYNVLFTPFRGSNITIIARNLTKEAALSLIENLNAELDDSRLGETEIDDTEEM